MEGYPIEKSKMLSVAGWFKVEYNYPQFDEYTQKIVANKTLDWDENKQVFIQNFNIVSLSIDEANFILEQKTAIAFEKLRAERNAKLSTTDYLLMSDYPISGENLVEIKAYRKALRDLPNQEGSPWLNGEIPWPTKPSFIE